MESLAVSRSLALSRISCLLQRKETMANAFLSSSRDLLLLKKPRMLKKYQLKGLINGKVVTVKEMERRRKISETKKGSIPWNKGKKHPEETIQRIRERTLEALSDPKVRKKMRGMQGTHSKKSKEKISAELKQIWHERLYSKRQQERLHGNWAQIISTAAKTGGNGERELDWDSYNKIRAELISDEMKERIEKRIRRRKEKVREEILARIKAKNAAKKGERRREETAAVKIKTHAKLKKRLTKLLYQKKQLDMSSSSKEIAPDTRRTGDEWDIELIKERVKIGVSLLGQLQLIMDRRKDS